MANQLIKCIPSLRKNDIKDGTFTQETVGVYYGFDTYNRSAKHHLDLIEIISKEFPEISMQDIDFYEITTRQSDRHAHMTMAYVLVPVDYVRQRLDEYHIL